MTGLEQLPDELAIRHRIAEQMRLLRLLRAIERALARFRCEMEQAEQLRNVSKNAGVSDGNGSEHKGVSRC